MLTKRMNGPLNLVVLAAALMFATPAQAIFLFIPIPNMSKPGALDKTLDALEKSTHTKALAYAMEDKIWGSKYWVWGQFAGQATQEDAERTAMANCENKLATARLAQVGGKPLYDFGNKTCVLHVFRNKTVWLPEPVQAAPTSVAATPATSEMAATAAAAAPMSDAAAPGAAQAAVVAPVEPLSAATPIAPLSLSSAVTPGPATPTATAPAATPVAAPESQAARRMRELNDLQKSGLITDDEYRKKRAVIIESI